MKIYFGQCKYILGEAYDLNILFSKGFIKSEPKELEKIWISAK